MVITFPNAYVNFFLNLIFKPDFVEPDFNKPDFESHRYHAGYNPGTSVNIAFNVASENTPHYLKKVLPCTCDLKDQTVQISKEFLDNTVKP